MRACGSRLTIAPFAFLPKTRKMLALKICVFFLIVWQEVSAYCYGNVNGKVVAWSCGGGYRFRSLPFEPFEGENRKVDAIQVPVVDSGANSNCIKDLLGKVAILFDKLNWSCNGKNIHDIIKEILVKLGENDLKEAGIPKVPRDPEGSQANVNKCLLEILKSNSKLNVAPVEIPIVNPTIKQAADDRNIYWDQPQLTGLFTDLLGNVFKKRGISNLGGAESAVPALANRVYDQNILFDNEMDY